MLHHTVKACFERDGTAVNHDAPSGFEESVNTQKVHWQHWIDDLVLPCMCRVEGNGATCTLGRQ